MKNNLICVVLSALFALNVSAQTVSDFENLTLAADSFWNGSGQPLGTTFTSGNAEFYNFFDTAFGGLWERGWVYSNKQDSTTAGFGNQYSAITAEGYDGSSNYAIGKGGSILRLTGDAAGKTVAGFYVTNGTFPYLSMKDGDSFSKQFGSPNDANGNPDGTNGEDWFLLTVKKWYNGTPGTDSVNFYLADYRFSNNAQDYIVNTWEWVDLSSLGNVDSLQFLLSSSDVGQFGMNTPAYVFIDHFTTNDVGVGIHMQQNASDVFYLYPNPAIDAINIASEIQNGTLHIYDAAGKEVYSTEIDKEKQTISLAEFSSGLYSLVLRDGQLMTSRTFLKQ